MLRFALTIFLSAFLLFLVQPLIGKAILPWFGGTPAVWTTCLLFFQTALLLGYAYAHWLVGHAKPKTQATVHLIVLGVSLIWLPLAVSESWAPTGRESPTWQVLGLLTASLLGPYAALSATAPLLQSWFAHTQPGKSPYWLYALSNFGSLLALLAFPFIFERVWGTQEQLRLWSGAYVAFLALCAVCAASVLFKTPSPEETLAPEETPAPAAEREPAAATRARPVAAAATKTASRKGKQKRGHDRPESVARAETPASEPPAARGTFDWMNTEIAAVRWISEKGEASAGAQVLWIVLPFVSAMLLSAGTNQLCQDVTVVPFLWILPLALYLLSFIFAFNFEYLYARRWWFIFLVTAQVWATFTLYLGGGAGLDLVVVSYSAVIFLGCLVCHCELVRLKPEPAKLTQFYLFMSLGGALGGAYVALVAPVVFEGYYEFHLSLFLCFVMPIVCAYGDPASTIYDGKPKMLWIALMCTLAGFSVMWISHIQTASDSILEQRRGFFGVKTVKIRPTDEVQNDGTVQLAAITLQHGSTLHGSQFLDKNFRDLPNSYYSVQSGVGLAIELHHKRQDPDRAKQRLNIGVVGLGAGTIAALAQPGDSVRFYEIDPQVEELARQHFTYLKDSAAHSEGGKVEVVLGDARISLAREAAEGDLPKFDVLVCDAFSSDAVPLHLLTREAFKIYRDRLQPDGILCMHVSNRYLELTRVVRGAAEDMGWKALNLQTFPDKKHIREGANWVVCAHPDNPFFKRPEVNDPKSPETRPAPWKPGQIVLWTDDRSNLMDVLDAPTAVGLDRPIEKVELVPEADGAATATTGEATPKAASQGTGAP